MYPRAFLIFHVRMMRLKKFSEILIVLVKKIFCSYREIYRWNLFVAVFQFFIQPFRIDI